MLAEAVAKPSPMPMPSSHRWVLANLRARIEHIGKDAETCRLQGSLPLGIAEIDSVLPDGGLPRVCLHEIVADDVGGAAAGFATVLLARFAGRDSSAMWMRRCYGESKLYGQGVAAFGFDLRRLLVVRVRREVDVLWAMEESLRCGGVSAVLGEIATVPPIALRRLQLAAESGGATGLLLRPPRVLAEGWATSRWRVASAPSQPCIPSSSGRVRPFSVRWRVELLRCRAATPASWLLDWCYETHRLCVAAELRDRPAAPPAMEYGRCAAI